MILYSSSDVYVCNSQHCSYVPLGDGGEIRVEIRGEADEIRGEIHGDAARVHLPVMVIGRELRKCCGPVRGVVT